MTKRQIVVRFLRPDEGGRRAGVPTLASGRYLPHVVVRDPARTGELKSAEAISGHQLLGVRFVEGPSDAVWDQELPCTVELLYDGVDYSALRPGAAILVVEGGTIVAIGKVLPDSDAG